MSEQCLLRDYGVLRFSGPDARAFLQGQLSNDMALLQPGTALLAGLHNPQGRVLALLRLWPDAGAADGVLAALPGELLAGVKSLLQRFVLRSKLQISDASTEWQLYGERDAQGLLHHHLQAAAAGAAPAADTATLDLQAWEALEVAAGLPEIHSATSGEFIAQMLNLDCIDAIAWKKGCYTGQEIVARAHYRGQVKRRMRRFVCAATELPAPGSALTTGDGVAVRVVRSARAADGRCECLAVAALDAHSRDERPLPYALPGNPASTPQGG